VLERKTKLELKNHHPSRVFESNRNQRLSHPSQAFEQIGIKDSIIHARRLKKNNQNQRIIIHPRRLKQIRLKKSSSIPGVWKKNPGKNRQVSGNNWQGTPPKGGGVWGGVFWAVIWLFQKS